MMMISILMAVRVILMLMTKLHQAHFIIIKYKINNNKIKNNDYEKMEI